MLDLIVRGARFGTADGPRTADIGIADGRIGVIAPSLAADDPSSRPAAAWWFRVSSGLISISTRPASSTRSRSAKARCHEAIRETAQAKRSLTADDVFPRGHRTLEKSISHGVMLMRTREFDVDIDMHLDLAETADGMLAEYVCRKTEEFGWGGRVTIGHVTQASLLPPDEFASLARRLVGAGVGVTILPATDLYPDGPDQQRHDDRISGKRKPKSTVSADRTRQS